MLPNINGGCYMKATRDNDGLDDIDVSLDMDLVNQYFRDHRVQRKEVVERKVDEQSASYSVFDNKSSLPDINPATGLEMSGGVDVGGNLDGTVSPISDYYGTGDIFTTDDY